ncbi:MAG: hypothetical protein HN742_41775 [Lentisphaerae bacterium]|jgi:hypothetical protein|nr:hypothetical protein [Lentisphaerota bacterium]MBT4815270.1 hypothetical protein [Lentisphaerota bacterium]MBT5611696.1 hypothetical protein [Lentisphaerota bacterium]MBT7061164.1 hypothetical protein [Lentisphaerota bacterium]MBT7848467.1 hypothetical protein [Lentisphaerota bacterium]
MIAFRDFAPQTTKRGFLKTEFQTFEEALSAANEWIAENQIDVVTIETVVLPEIWSEDGTTDTELTTSGEMMRSWYQFIRIWYRNE